MGTTGKRQRRLSDGYSFAGYRADHDPQGPGLPHRGQRPWVTRTRLHPVFVEGLNNKIYHRHQGAPGRHLFKRPSIRLRSEDADHRRYDSFKITHTDHGRPRKLCHSQRARWRAPRFGGNAGAAGREKAGFRRVIASRLLFPRWRASGPRVRGRRATMDYLKAPSAPTYVPEWRPYGNGADARLFVARPTDRAGLPRGSQRQVKGPARLRAAAAIIGRGDRRGHGSLTHRHAAPCSLSVLPLRCRRAGSAARRSGRGPRVHCPYLPRWCLETQCPCGRSVEYGCTYGCPEPRGKSAAWRRQIGSWNRAAHMGTVERH